MCLQCDEEDELRICDEHLWQDRSVSRHQLPCRCVGGEDGSHSGHISLGIVTRLYHTGIVFRARRFVQSVIRSASWDRAILDECVKCVPAAPIPWHANVSRVMELTSRDAKTRNRLCCPHTSDLALDEDHRSHKRFAPRKPVGTARLLFVDRSCANAQRSCAHPEEPKMTTY